MIVNLFVSVLNTGFTLWLLSLFVGNTLLSEALHVSQPSFHIGLVAFGGAGDARHDGQVKR